MKSPPHPQKWAPRNVSHLGVCPEEILEGTSSALKEGAPVSWVQGLARSSPFGSNLPFLLPAPASQNYMVENCVRISLAGVFLLILLAILAEAGHSQHGSSNGTQGTRRESAHQRH